MRAIAVFTFKREGYGKTDFDLKDTLQALAYIGTWEFLLEHWRFGLDEYKRAFSKKLFLERLQRLIPSLEMDDIAPMCRCQQWHLMQMEI